MPIPLVTNPVYSYEFPAKHRFAMEKFSLLLDVLKQQNIAQQNNIFRPGKARQELLELAHSKDYLHRFINNLQTSKELRRMGLPWSEPLVRRTLISPNGTLLASLLALQHGVACHLAGGTHHAHRDFASGFCILNDLAISALTLTQQQKCHRVLIFDCDVHQGDGTASILENNSAIFTCSIHCEKNFPMRKAKSDLDIGLPKGMEDEQYLCVVTETLESLLKKVKPDLVIYDAGVDIYKHDPLGLLNISLEGISKREHAVLSLCKETSTPVVTVIGGGYDDDRKALAKRHAIVSQAAHTIYG